MDTSQIRRFPKKYAELFKNISNEDIGKIIKGLFLSEIDNLEGLNKAYYDIIKVDLENLEKSAINGKKGGRPKKEETPGYKNKKPQVIENENLKERKRERKRERESKKESNNIIINNNNEQSSSLVKVDNRNEDINEMQVFIKEKVMSLGLIYKSGKQERNRIKNILTAKQFGEICELSNMNRYQFVESIILLSSKLEFWSGKIYNAETLYKHYASVYNDAKRVKQEKENDPEEERKRKLAELEEKKKTLFNNL